MTLATLFVAQATNTDLTISQQITTVPKSKVGERIGRLDEKDVIRLNQAMMVFLGLAVSPRTGRNGE
jgi:mRNA interferase MazF